MAKKFLSIRNLTIIAVLIALDIVLTRFCSLQAWNTRVGFGFVPVVIAALLLGPVAAALTAGTSDLLGALLFPTGPFFPGFTLTAAIMGFILGFFLYNRRKWGAVRVFLAVIISQLICSLLLNTFWISFVYGSSFTGLLYTRLLQVLLTAPIQIITIYALCGIFERQDMRRAMLG